MSVTKKGKQKLNSKKEKDPSDAVLKVDWDSYINTHRGVPVVAWWLTTPTSIHEDAGLIPGLTQSVKDQALL